MDVRIHLESRVRDECIYVQNIFVCKIYNLVYYWQLGHWPIVGDLWSTFTHSRGRGDGQGQPEGYTLCPLTG